MGAPQHAEPPVVHPVGVRHDGRRAYAHACREEEVVEVPPVRRAAAQPEAPPPLNLPLRVVLPLSTVTVILSSAIIRVPGVRAGTVLAPALRLQAAARQRANFPIVHDFLFSA